MVSGQQVAEHYRAQANSIGGLIASHRDMISKLGQRELELQRAPNDDEQYTEKYHWIGDGWKKQ